ncbi:MAG: hypothetical protein AB7P40_11715 [Chloroflexota bacterium]
MQRIAVRRWLSMLALALAVSLVPVGAAPAHATLTVAQDVPSRPSTAFEAWFDVEQPPELPFEAVQMVVDFPVGAKVARHVHGGPGYITMITNELTMWIGDADGRVYGEGESFVEPLGVAAEGANLSGASSSVLVTYLIPEGSAVTTLTQATPGAIAGQLPPGAAPRFESRLRFDMAPSKYKVGQMLQTYAPGAWTMSAIAEAPRLVTVVTGEVTVLNGASERTYKAGEFWTETPGQAWLSGNQGEDAAIVAVSTVKPE